MKNRPPHEIEENRYPYDIENTASATECTGLIPTPPVDEEETDAYQDLYDVPRQGTLEELEETLGQNHPHHTPKADREQPDK
ncbi:MAG: hypothetical protein LIO46_03875 [Clostridiales bacterium]|nr:hypothetical protein [Clostridiales bacterium]